MQRALLPQVVPTIVMLVAADVETCRIPAAAARALLHLLSTATTDNSQLCITEFGLQAMTYHLEGHLSLLAQFDHLLLDELAADLIDRRIKHEGPLDVVLPIIILDGLRYLRAVPRQTQDQLCLGSTCKSTPRPIPHPTEARVRMSMTSLPRMAS